MRLIDGDELIEHVWRDRLDSRERIANLVKSMPTVKPQKKGAWHDIGGVIRYGCPFCHHAYESKSNYCPNCGADMRGEQK